MENTAYQHNSIKTTYASNFINLSIYLDLTTDPGFTDKPTTTAITTHQVSYVPTTAAIGTHQVTDVPTTKALKTHQVTDVQTTKAIKTQRVTDIPTTTAIKTYQVTHIPTTLKITTKTLLTDSTTTTTQTTVVPNGYCGRQVFNIYLKSLSFNTSLIRDFEFTISSNYYSSIKQFIISEFDGDSNEELID